MAKQMRIPKKIAGIKIPRQLRKGPMGEFLASTTGQVLLAEALLAAGRALLHKRDDPDSPTGEFLRHPVQQLRTAGNKVADGTRRAAEEVGDRGETLSRAFGEAIHAFTASLASANSSPADFPSLDSSDSLDTTGRGGAYANQLTEANEDLKRQSNL